MATIYVHDGSLGERVTGTREQYRTALAECWVQWHRDSDTELSLEEYIEESLDECLREATEDEIAELPSLAD